MCHLLYPARLDTGNAWAEVAREERATRAVRVAGEGGDAGALMVAKAAKADSGNRRRNNEGERRKLVVAPQKSRARGNGGTVGVHASGDASDLAGLVTYQQCITGQDLTKGILAPNL